MTVLEMTEKRAALLDRRKVLHEKAIAEEREFTDDETKLFSEHKAEADKLERLITQGDLIASEQDALDQPTGRIVSPTRPDSAKAAGAFAADSFNVGSPRLIDDPTGGYGNVGRGEVDELTKRRWFGEFALEVYESKRGVAPRLSRWHQACYAAGDGLTTSIGSEGAYLIPTQFGALIDRITLEVAVVRPRATKIPMTAKSVSFPMVDDTSHATTVFGGILAYFKSEESQLTSSKPSFADVELTVHKLTVLCYVSNEMLDWSPISMGNWLPEKMAQALAWKEDDKFISGSGAAGEPTGLLNAAASLQISKEALQAATTIVFENIVNMDARLFAPAGRQNVIWVANQTCKPQFPQLFAGGGTSQVPIFLPATGATDRPLQTLYGYPIVYTEHCETLGTVGDLLLCNLDEYYIGDVSGKTRTARDMGLKFDYDQTAFRLVTYTGGLCPWRSVFTPQHGNTLSPILKLQTRG